MAVRASSYAHAGSAPGVAVPWLQRYSRGLASLRAWLPQGGSLPDAEWQRRHAGIMTLLWFNVFAVPVFALALGRSSALHVLESGMALGVMAAIATSRRMSSKLRMATSSLALLSAVALVVHASGGIVVMHFYFFVIIIVLTLYEDWMPFLLALVFVLLHHGLLGTFEPKSVFDRPEDGRIRGFGRGSTRRSWARRAPRVWSPGDSTRTCAGRCARLTSRSRSSR